MLEYAPTALVIIAWLGATTAFFAATCGLVSNDAKRVIAFSTCSQLGYMMMAVGLAQYSAGLMHLVTHAVFKALLFMSAGSVLHAMSDQQDTRRLGGLVAFLPLTYASMAVGTLSLLAIPGMTGFYSKDTVLELAAGTYSLSGFVVYTIGTFSAGLTAFYSMRLMALVFFTTPRASASSYTNAHEASPVLAAPLVFLAVLAIVAGYVMKDLWTGMGTDFLAASWHALPSSSSSVEAHFAVDTLVKLMPAIITILGAAAALYVYHGGQATLVRLGHNAAFLHVYAFLVAQWRWGAVLTNSIIMPAFKLGGVASKVLDRGLIEAAGPHGLSTVLPAAGGNAARYDTSLVTTYALYVMLGLLALITVQFAPVLTGYTADASLVLVLLASLMLLPAQHNNTL